MLRMQGKPLKDLMKKVMLPIYIAPSASYCSFPILSRNKNRIKRRKKEREKEKNRAKKKGKEKENNLPKLALDSWLRSKNLLKVKEVLYEAINAAVSMKDFASSDDAKKMARGFLKDTAGGHVFNIVFIVAANAWERYEDMSKNEEACLSLLDEINKFAKIVIDLQKALQNDPESKKRMEDLVKEAIELIIETCIACCTQIEASKRRRYCWTTGCEGELTKLKEQLRQMYTSIQVQLQIVDLAAWQRLRSQDPECSKHAVGIEKPVQDVIEKLEWETNKKAVAVILHGFGGMGKTTLANAVFARLFEKKKEGCRFSFVELFKDTVTPPNIEELQKIILRDLKGDEPDEIRSYGGGQKQIESMLEKEEAFIYIDNVLLPDDTREQGQDALTQLLPENMANAKKLRLLITTRNKDAVRSTISKGVETKFYTIESLPDSKAVELLEKELHDNGNQLDASQIDGIGKICGGVPGLLKVLAGFINDPEGNAVDNCKSLMKEAEEKNWKGAIGESIEQYVFAYEKLEDKLKDPFLDICSFFRGWDWKELSDIVGETELKRLEQRALVTRDVKSMTARVDDVILQVGLQRTQGNRFRLTSATEIEKFSYIEDEDLQKIKGIWASDNKDPLRIPASKLDLMSGSLRVLKLGPLTDVEGKCEKEFKELVFFSAVTSHLPFYVSKLKGCKKLRHLCYNPADLQTLSQGLSNEENLLKQFQSEFDNMLTHGEREPLNISGLPLHTLLLVMFDGQQEFRPDFPLPLLEESIDDIQTHFEMVYFGNHWDQLPKKVADRIMGHAPANRDAKALFQKLLSLVVGDQTDFDRNLTSSFQMTAEIVSGKKGGTYLSCWKFFGHGSDENMVEDFVVTKCGRYVKLKQLAERPGGSPIALLTELFRGGEEEISLSFLKNKDGESTKVGVDELQGKTILLDIRPANICFDVPLHALVEMYNVVEKERFNFEIITVPIFQGDTTLDVSEKFSQEVPWLVLQTPWQLTNTTKYFLVDNWRRQRNQGWDRWYPNRMRIIESDGTISPYRNPGVLRMVNTWGAAAYPFTAEKEEELIEKEKTQMEAMSHAMFLFQHLERVAEQLREATGEQKMIWLCCCHEKEFTNSMKNVLTELSDIIYIIYIPIFHRGRVKFGYFTATSYEEWYSLEPSKMSSAEMGGIFSLSLSEYEAMRFWARIRSLKEGIIAKDQIQLREMLSIPEDDLHDPDSWMFIMDEDGNLITTKGKEIVKLLSEKYSDDIVKELMQQLIKGTKNSWKETLFKLQKMSYIDSEDSERELAEFDSEDSEGELEESDEGDLSEELCSNDADRDSDDGDREGDDVFQEN